MLRELLPGSRLAVLTRSAGARAESPERLAQLARAVPTVTVGSVGQAVRLAKKSAGPRELVVVAGSFMIVGEALSELE